MIGRSIDQVDGILPTIDTFKLFLHHKHPHYLDLLEHSRFPKAGKLKADVLTSSKAIAVADASVSQLTQHATVSWIITDRSSNMCDEGISGCPDLYHACDSYGSELFGIYSILVMAKLVVEYYGIEHGALTLTCDNDASLDAGTIISPSNKACQNYFDLIWEISNILRELPVYITKFKTLTCCVRTQAARRTRADYIMLNYLSYV